MISTNDGSIGTCCGQIISNPCLTPGYPDTLLDSYRHGTQYSFKSTVYGIYCIQNTGAKSTHHINQIQICLHGQPFLTVYTKSRTTLAYESIQYKISILYHSTHIYHTMIRCRASIHKDIVSSIGNNDRNTTILFRYRLSPLSKTKQRIRSRYSLDRFIYATLNGIYKETPPVIQTLR
jgi:hypothetical protein